MKLEKRLKKSVSLNNKTLSFVEDGDINKWVWESWLLKFREVKLLHFK